MLISLLFLVRIKLFCLIQVMSSRRRKIKSKWEENNNGKAVDKMYVKEWLHHNAKRNTKIKFGPDEAFHLMNRKGVKMRSVSIKGCVYAFVLNLNQKIYWHKK